MNDELEAAVTNQKLVMYSLKEGDTCLAELSGIAVVFDLVIAACTRGKISHPDLRFVRMALSSCRDLIETNCYNPELAYALETGLDASLRLAKRLRPRTVRRAWRELYA